MYERIGWLMGRVQSKQDTPYTPKGSRHKINIILQYGEKI